MAGKKIINLPFGIALTGAEFFEVSQLIGMVQTSTKVPLDDIRDYVTPIIGPSEVAYGDPSTGVIKSSGLFYYDETINNLVINAAGSFISLYNNAIIDEGPRLGLSSGNFHFGEYVGSPFISAMFMNVTPSTTNYTIARTNGGQVYLNGDTGITYALNGSTKAETTPTYSLINQPLGIGDVPSAQLDIVRSSVSTGQKIISAKYNSIVEVFSIDDNADVQFNTGLGVTVKGSNGVMKVVSNGGVNPSLTFQYLNGAATSGTFAGDGTNVILYNLTNNFGIGTSYFNAMSKLSVRGSSNADTHQTYDLMDNSGLTILKGRCDGYNIFRAVTSAIANADLANSQFTPWYDESASELVFQIKDSTGTVKEARVFAS